MTLVVRRRYISNGIKGYLHIFGALYIELCSVLQYFNISSEPLLLFQFYIDVLNAP